MIWNDKKLVSGQVVSSQTTSGDFKDLLILSGRSGQWSLVSLLDGYSAEPLGPAEMVARLNEHHFVPLAKMIGRGPLPEDRIGLPVVAIYGLRSSP